MKRKLVIATAVAGAILLSPGVAQAKQPCHSTTTTTITAVKTTEKPCKTTTTSTTVAKNTAPTTAPSHAAGVPTTSSVRAVSHAGTTSTSVPHDDSIGRGYGTDALPVAVTDIAQPILATQPAARGLARTGVPVLPLMLTGLVFVAIGMALIPLGGWFSKKKEAR